MKNKFRLGLAGSVLLVVLVTMSTTGALWHGEVSINPGTVTTGNLELLAGGEPVAFPFDALVANNLAPGDAISAPLTITNGGSTKLAYTLESVSIGSTDTATSSTADTDLASTLTLLVTDDATCDGNELASSVETLYQGKLAAGSFPETRQLSPSSSETVCITVGLPETTPSTASSGAVSATFIFRGNQVQ